MLRARLAFMNGLFMVDGPQTTWSVVLCDLVDGKTTEVTLSSPSGITFDIDDEHLQTYRLTRSGAVEEKFVYIDGSGAC